MPDKKKAQNKSTKNFVKNNWITIVVLIYLISPLDIVPEGLIPAIGQIDDALLALLEIIRKWYQYTKEN